MPVTRLVPSSLRPLRTRIVAADQVQTSSVVNDHGGTALIVNLVGERRELGFAARRPTHDDRVDEVEQSRTSSAPSRGAPRRSRIGCSGTSRTRTPSTASGSREPPDDHDDPRGDSITSPEASGAHA